MSNKKSNYNDYNTTLQELKEKVREFSEKRDWQQYHNPKDLAIAITIETTELLEEFRFLNNKEINKKLTNKKQKKKIEFEIIDILNLTLRLADILGMDLTERFYEKLRINSRKYPIKKVKGKPYKYTHYNKKG